MEDCNCEDEHSSDCSLDLSTNLNDIEIYKFLESRTPEVCYSKENKDFQFHNNGDGSIVLKLSQINRIFLTSKYRLRRYYDIFVSMNGIDQLTTIEKYISNHIS